MTEPSPIGVVIPAYNEAELIGRLLDALAPGVADGSLEVVVVPNGCHDDTAAIARAAGVSVVELEVGNKIAALNAGDAAITAFPRFYVDGDVVLSAAGIQAMGREFDDEILAVSPSLSPDTSASSWLTKSYLRIWYSLEWASSSLGGRGCYGVSESGRARWGAFPDLADDGFVDTLFEPSERRIVDGVESVVQAPRTLRSVIQIKRRVHSGNRKIEDEGPKVTSSTGWLSAVRARPRLAIDAPTYVLTTLVSRALGIWDLRRGSTIWHRDGSSRAES